MSMLYHCIIGLQDFSNLGIVRVKADGLTPFSYTQAHAFIGKEY